jgi:hypothetical protein
MKKLIIITFLFLGFVLPAKAGHYRGFVEIAPGSIADGEFAIAASTTHGLQLNKKFFLGLGVSGFTSDYWKNISLYLDSRFDFVSSRRFSPFFDLKLGFASVEYEEYYDYYEYTESYSGLYVAPTFGVRYRLKDKLALNIGLGVDYIGDDFGSSIFLKFGIEF